MLMKIQQQYVCRQGLQFREQHRCCLLILRLGGNRHYHHHHHQRQLLFQIQEDANNILRMNNKCSSSRNTCRLSTTTTTTTTTIATTIRRRTYPTTTSNQSQRQLFPFRQQQQHFHPFQQNRQQEYQHHYYMLRTFSDASSSSSSSSSPTMTIMASSKMNHQEQSHHQNQNVMIDMPPAAAAAAAAASASPPPPVRNIIKLQICNSPLDIQSPSSSTTSSTTRTRSVREIQDEEEFVDALFTMKAKFTIDDIHDTIHEMIGDHKIDSTTIQYYNETTMNWEALTTEEDLVSIQSYKGGMIPLKVRSTEYYDETMTSLEVIDDGMEPEPTPILPLTGYYDNPYTGTITNNNNNNKKTTTTTTTTTTKNNNNNESTENVRPRRDLMGKVIYEPEDVYQSKIYRGYDKDKYMNINAHDLYEYEFENLIKDIVAHLQSKKYERDVSNTTVYTMIHTPSQFTVPTKEYVLDYYMFHKRTKKKKQDVYYRSLLLNHPNALQHIIQCLHYDHLWKMSYHPPHVEYDDHNYNQWNNRGVKRRN